MSPENQAALAARRLLPRDFLTITARDRTSGAPVTVGFWSDLSTVAAFVIDPETGLAASRSFYGAGGLIQISDIVAASDLAVQNVTITMSQLDEQVEQAVRLYDIKQARVEIHTGLLDPDTRLMVAPGDCVWVGFVDELRILTPSEGEVGSVTLTCASHLQELLRSNPATRSHEDQMLRDPTDDFFVDAAVVGDWDHQWGQVQGKVEAKKGIFGWGNLFGFL
jgi:hypothetical protein